jgi:hypothetical protein
MLALSLVLLLLFIILPRHGFNATPAATYARWCECVDYVRNRFQLDPSVGPYFLGAADMGPYLENHGFVTVPEPVSGAIIVFQRSFGSGINATYGHVGVIVGVQPVNGSTWNLTVRGARQTWPEWSEHGCNNVSDMGHIVVSRGSGQTAFYTRQPQPGRLVISEPLQLAPAAPRVDEAVEARFVVQNVGGQPLVLEELTAGGRQGSDWEAAMHADFPYQQAIELAPGQSYVYQASRSFAEPGRYFSEPVARIGGSWQNIESANRVLYDVVPHPAAPTPEPTPEPPTAPTPEPTIPPEPSPQPWPTPDNAPRPTPIEQPARRASFNNADLPDPQQPDSALPAISDEWSSDETLAEGTYIFRARAGRGTRVYLDETLLIDGLQRQDSYVGSWIVSGGAHRVHVVVYENNDGTRASFQWERLGP